MLPSLPASVWVGIYGPAPFPSPLCHGQQQTLMVFWYDRGELSLLDRRQNDYVKAAVASFSCPNLWWFALNKISRLKAVLCCCWLSLITTSSHRFRPRMEINLYFEFWCIILANHFESSFSSHPRQRFPRHSIICPHNISAKLISFAGWCCYCHGLYLPN